MIVNPDKFKTILLTKGRQNVSEYPITSKRLKTKTKDSTVLLDITIDYKLSFDKHVSQLCQKASSQLNVFERLAAYMNQSTQKNDGAVVYTSPFKLCLHCLVLHVKHL